MHELRRSERVTFSGSGGNLLAGIIDLPVTTPTDFILFSHCFTCNKDLKAIVRISRRLAEHGWGVLRYDFSGLGNSEGDFSKSNFTTNREDLFAAANFLAKQYLPPTLLIGHSFGGAASLSCAEEIGSVRGVVCLASPSDTQHLANLLVRRNPDIERVGSGQVDIGGRLFDIDKQMVDNLRSHDLPSWISRLTKPVLVFHSMVDETLGYEHALRIFSLVNNRREDQAPSPGASLITLPNSDHLLTNHPADIPFVAEAIHAWLKRLIV
jgi:uncharacterized protein